MSPEQRADAIAEILCTIGLRAQRQKSQGDWQGDLVDE